MQSWEPLLGFWEVLVLDMWDIGVLVVRCLLSWVSGSPYSLQSTVRVWEPHPHPHQS